MLVNKRVELEDIIKEKAIKLSLDINEQLRSFLNTI